MFLPQVPSIKMCWVTQSHRPTPEKNIHPVTHSADMGKVWDTCHIRISLRTFKGLKIQGGHQHELLTVGHTFMLVFSLALLTHDYLHGFLVSKIHPKASHHAARSN